MIQPGTAIGFEHIEMVFHGRMASLESSTATGVMPRVLKLASVTDPRGTLVAADAGEGLPFPAVRCFHVRDVPPGAVRARHAQRRNEELISCPVGACTVELWWHSGHAVHRLADPETALHIPPWVWVECRDFSEDAVLLVLCSRAHDPEDHITDFSEFEAGPTDRL